jgi:hypothetical protein
MSEKKYEDHQFEEVEISSQENGSPAHERLTRAEGEAADLYGDIQTAQEYGYVKRGSVHRVLDHSLKGF